MSKTGWVIILVIILVILEILEIGLPFLIVNLIRYISKGRKYWGVLTLREWHKLAYAKCPKKDHACQECYYHIKSCLSLMVIHGEEIPEDILEEYRRKEALRKFGMRMK